MIGCWSAEEDALLRQRKDEGLRNEAIAAEMPGRTVAAVKSRWAVLTEGSGAKEARREAWIVRSRERMVQQRNGAEPRRSTQWAPEEVWAERNARMMEPISITGFVFGDPTPSRSALAQRRG